MSTETSDAAAPVQVAPPLEERARQYLRDVPTLSVLVVDDDREIREVVGEILEHFGFRVAVAADGVEASELLEHGLQPSAIVLDMMMPRMDGWTFLARLRSDPRYEALPVVVASAMVAQPPRGADALLQKPFSLTELHKAVRDLCAH